MRNNIGTPALLLMSMMMSVMISIGGKAQESVRWHPGAREGISPHAFTPAKDGIIRLATHPGARLYNVNEILDAFHLSAKHKNLKVCIDRQIIDQPELLRADLQEIDDVVIASGRFLGFTDPSLRQQPFIYITLKKIPDVTL